MHILYTNIYYEKIKIFNENVRLIFNDIANIFYN